MITFEQLRNDADAGRILVSELANADARKRNKDLEQISSFALWQSALLPTDELKTAAIRMAIEAAFELGKKTVEREVFAMMSLN